MTETIKGGLCSQYSLSVMSDLFKWNKTNRECEDKDQSTAQIMQYLFQKPAHHNITDILYI